MPAAQVVKRFGSLDHAPGVEPSGDFDRRVLARWASVTAELAGHTLAIVTHDAVIACLLENVVRQTGRPSRPCASRPRAEPARAARRSLVGCRPGRRPR
jgi:broad specificity phosphatase PhoE